ncbi:MAG: NAD(P)/FAD-dependent oxidoreductase [Ruminococcaceae bacterium]|nr:NAD(P)/FAD-dependent oxidoreductase [Oscillospiraceae bacterium]
MDLKNSSGVAVIGGGAAGLMAAISAARMGAEVTIFEKNDRCGKKLAITGKGRCNVTNDCTVEEFLQNVPTNPRFLYSALGRFDTRDTQDFFAEAGVPLKVERGRRVFPVSDKADDIVKALVKTAKELGVRTLYEKVLSLVLENGDVTGLKTDSAAYKFGAVIICTGGKSYPRTGSDGDGYAFARAAGHTVTPLLPSLVPMTSQSKICPALQGLSLKNTSLSIVRKDDGKEIYSDFGEMMFTHFGLTGPMILSASAHLPDAASGKYEAHVDLKPALDEKALDARILSDFSKYANKDFVNALGDLLPQKMIPVIISLSGIDERKKVNSITKEERRALVSVIKCLRISLSGFRPINEAIITKGGVSVKEIDPKTMRSKLCRSLYFAGEVIDLDAYTGGYNLQIAFSTGVLAGESAALSLFE